MSFVLLSRLHDTHDLIFAFFIPLYFMSGLITFANDKKSFSSKTYMEESDTLHYYYSFVVQCMPLVFMF